MEEIVVRWTKESPFLWSATCDPYRISLQVQGGIGNTWRWELIDLDVSTEEALYEGFEDTCDAAMGHVETRLSDYLRQWPHLKVQVDRLLSSPKPEPGPAPFDFEAFVKQIDMLMPGQDSECVDCGALLGPGKFMWMRPWPKLESLGAYVSSPVCELCTFRFVGPLWEAEMERRHVDP